MVGLSSAGGEGQGGGNRQGSGGELEVSFGHIGLLESGFGLHHDEKGRCGGVDDLYQSGANAVAADALQIVQDHLPLGVAFLVTGIDGDVEDGVLIHEADGIADSGKGGLAEGGDGLVPSREPAEVEHTRTERHVHVLFYVGMGIQDKLVVIGAPRFHQMLLGRSQGLLLDIEGIDSDGVHTIPNPDKEVKRVLVALDPYEKAVNESINGNYDVLITHHPLFWGEPLPNTPPENWYNRLMAAGIASFSFHIRLDKISGGVNDILAEKLALKNAIPFDEPEIEGLGRIGDLETPMDVKEFAKFVKSALDVPTVTYTELPDNRKIKRVAVLGGSASDAISSAALAGADAIVGGEFKHHTYGYAALEGNGRGIAIIEAGHYHTEFPVCQKLFDLVKDLIPDVEINILPCDNTYSI